MSMHSIGHVAICVSDLDRAVQFYQRLGLTLSYRTADMAYFYGDRPALDGPNANRQGLALMRLGSAEAKPHFGFACASREEVEQRHRELTQQGVTVTPIQQIGEAAAFYGQDPSGNWFEYLFEAVSEPALEPSVEPVVKSVSLPKAMQTSTPQSKQRVRATSSRSKGFG